MTTRFVLASGPRPYAAHALVIVLLAAALASEASAESANSVPLERRAWANVPVAEASAPAAPRSQAGAYASHRTVSHAKEVTDRFHVTAVRLWLYRSFLPKSDDSDILGIETNSAWGCTRPLELTRPDGSNVDGRFVACAGPVRLSKRSWHTVSASASDRPAAGPAAAAEKRVLILPIEFEADNGATNGNANLIRLLPAYEWPVRSRWRIQHLDLIPLVDAPGGITGLPGNPAPVVGPRTFGLSDITHLSFFAPRASGPLLWGFGAALGIPTATDDVLGSGKWTAGPALRLTYRKGPWNLGFVGAQRWSFAGETDRADVNQLMVRGAFRRQLGEDWFLLSAPIITANWNGPSSERWLVPLGGGIGRKFKFAGRPWAASLQGYANVIRPTGAPTWSIRLSLTAFIPLER